mmetsp:Transcript_69352/g.160675  ORF Transcript_69352/g.160675 Transcript_69352/m.160675 type:complete len:264 (+) Transcript_69352:143-934(+)
MVVRGVESDGREVGELRLEDFLCLAEHDVTASTLRHAAKDHHVVDCVEFLVLGKSVAHVHTDGLVDLAHLRLLLRVRHCLLDQLQTLRVALVLDGAHVWMRVRVVRRDVHTRLRSQLRCATLPQVHVRQASVRALCPRVGRCLWVHVKPDIAEFVDPTHEGTVRIGVARTFAAAHGDAKDIARADLLHSRQGRHLAIVDDLQWDIACQLRCKPPEDPYHLLLVHSRRDVWEDVAPSCTVVLGNGASCTATDRINPRERLLGLQ